MFTPWPLVGKQHTGDINTCMKEIVNKLILRGPSISTGMQNSVGSQEAVFFIKYVSDSCSLQQRFSQSRKCIQTVCNSYANWARFMQQSLRLIFFQAFTQNDTSLTYKMQKKIFFRLPHQLKGGRNLTITSPPVSQRQFHLIGKKEHQNNILSWAQNMLTEVWEKKCHGSFPSNNLLE